MAVSFEEIILNKYRENHLAHAYLIETNDLENTYQKVLNLCKKIECHDSYSENCKSCNVCNLIDLGNHPNLITIVPEGAMIKKNQIIELQERFLTKPVYSKKNIYVIKQAEKLNDSSGNTILKFLEEPEPNIIGFLITENMDKLLPTITSRCQVFNDNVVLDREESNDIKNLALKYQDSLENSGMDIMLQNKIIADQIKEKDLAALFFKTILNKYLEDYSDNPGIGKKKKIQIIRETLENISYNVNIELLLDKYVIEMSEIND